MHLLSARPASTVRTSQMLELHLSEALSMLVVVQDPHQRGSLAVGCIALAVVIGVHYASPYERVTCMVLQLLVAAGWTFGRHACSDR